MPKHAISMLCIKGHDMDSSGVDSVHSRNIYTGLDGAEGFLGEVVSQMDQEGYAGVKPHKDRLGYSKGDLGKKGLEIRKSMID